MPKVGNLAPVFTLKGQDGSSISLGDFREKKNVVLYFYPKAMTPGCTIQACGIRDKERSFSDNETVVLGVSPDSVDRLGKFVEKEKLNFTLLSDEEKMTIKKYGVWGAKKFMGKQYDGVLRTTFIIGKDGRVKHIMDKVKTKTHHDDVLQFIQENL